jgi:hypothetical protein
VEIAAPNRTEPKLNHDRYRLSTDFNVGRAAGA